MSWIKVIPFEEATGKLLSLYNKIKGPNGQIDNVLSIHSLRPHTLVGHMSLYKNCLHHANNSFPNWFLELLGSYTSYINHCDYCYDHHSTGMARFLDDETRAQELKAHIENDTLESCLSEKEFALVKYAKKLTLDIGSVSKIDVETLKLLGYDDGEILEVNQVVSYFNYANRTVMGLGVTTTGEVLGLSPKNKDDDSAWSHE